MSPFHQAIYQSLSSLSIYLPICLSLSSLSIYLPIHPTSPVHLSVSLYLFIHVSQCNPPICPICLFLAISPPPSLLSLYNQGEEDVPHLRSAWWMETSLEFCKWIPSVFRLFPGDETDMLNTSTPMQSSNLRWHCGLFWIVIPDTTTPSLP